MNPNNIKAFKGLIRRSGINLIAALLVTTVAVSATAQTKSSSTTTTTTTQNKGGGQTTTTKSSSSSQSYDGGTATRNAQGGTFTAKNEASSSSGTSTSYSNAGDKEMGGGELKNGQTVWEGGGEFNKTAQAGGKNANVSATVTGAAKGQVQMGSNGAVAELELGLEAELKALANFQAGDDNFGAAAQAEAKIQAILKAQAKIGAYIDEKGITIGFDARAEAMVSAEASLNMSLTLFGAKASVKATVKAQAGASASATAMVTIGFDGKVHIKAGMGATVGLGAGMYFDAEVDTEQLMKNLGFKSLDELIAWSTEMSNNPDKLASYIANEAAPNLAKGALKSAKDSIVDSLESLFIGGGGKRPGGGAEGEEEEEGDAAMKGIGGGGKMPGEGAGTDKEYDREKKYNTWSK